jgi:hypothetical protein
MKSQGAAFAIVLVTCAATLAAVIGSRLSEQAATMLAGAACGAGVAVPLAIVIGVYIGSQRSQRASRESAPPPQPIVVMTPPQPQQSAPALPTWASLQPASYSLIASEPRQYTILGEETVIDGTDAVR